MNIEKETREPKPFCVSTTVCCATRNYGGESSGAAIRVIQKINDGRFDYPFISPSSMRNALREMFADKRFDLPCNRSRLEPTAGRGKGEDGAEADEKQQLAVEFKKFPDPSEFADDFFMGYLLAVKGKELDKLRREKGPKYKLKSDSVLRMNLAKAMAPFRYQNNSIFTQSPKLSDENPWTPGGGEAASKSAPLNSETAVTAFQYPFALSWQDCKPKPEWTRKLLQAIGELNGVAGNASKSYFEMAPASVVVRLTPQLVAGYDTYGFRIRRDPRDDQAHTHTYPEVVEGLLHGKAKLDDNGAPKRVKDGKSEGPIEWEVLPDYSPAEFYLGGKIVKDMEAEHDCLIAGFAREHARADAKTVRPLTPLENLKLFGVNLDRDPRRLLEAVGKRFTEGMA